MATTMVRPSRSEPAPRRQGTPERWQAALQRALAEGVQVRQLAGCGAWLATSGTDATKAYELLVVGGIVRECGCPAGQHGDPVCKHAARYYNLVGLLDLEDDPEPPTPAAPALPLVPCWNCGGAGRERSVRALFGIAA